MSKTNKHSKTSHSNDRRQFLKQAGTAAAGLGFLSLPLPKSLLTSITEAATLSSQDKPNTHNMLVVGEQTAYLSHLPMFHGLNKTRTDFVSPHRFQVILEATFADGDKNLTETYLADRRDHATEKMYSINPALFVLPDLDPKGKALKTFRGNTVYRGHLERASTPLFGFMEPFPAKPPAGGLFDVNVNRVVHFHKLTPGAAKPAQLQYILFGKGSEIFMAHFIAAPPDFDQVIGVKVNGQQFTDEQLAGGIKANFAGRPNTAKTRLRETQKVLGMFQLAGTDGKPLAGSNAKPLEVEVIKEFYFEEGELRIPPTFDPTPEEKRSGFGE